MDSLWVLNSSVTGYSISSRVPTIVFTGDHGCWLHNVLAASAVARLLVLRAEVLLQLSVVAYAFVVRWRQQFDVACNIWTVLLLPSVPKFTRVIPRSQRRNDNRCIFVAGPKRGSLKPLLPADVSLLEQHILVGELLLNAENQHEFSNSVTRSLTS